MPPCSHSAVKLYKLSLADQRRETVVPACRLSDGNGCVDFATEEKRK
jgi:hypothetical protein